MSNIKKKQLLPGNSSLNFSCSNFTPKCCSVVTVFLKALTFSGGCRKGAASLIQDSGASDVRARAVVIVKSSLHRINLNLKTQTQS